MLRTSYARNCIRLLQRNLHCLKRASQHKCHYHELRTAVPPLLSTITTTKQKVNPTRCYAVDTGEPKPTTLEIDFCVDAVTYERVCADTLDALCDYFEELTESATHINGSDVSYSDGVLTVNLGNEFGTYVINRQTPNKQIWLSSPTSGPKRYDYVLTDNGDKGKWIYKHTGESMHKLLQSEIQNILKEQKVNFLKLPYS